MSSRAATDVAAVILAAGAGRRMGNVPKCLLRLDGEPLLVRQLRLLAQAGVSQVIVVLGHHAEVIAAALQEDPAPQPAMPVWRTVLNPDPDAGSASSLRCALLDVARGRDVMVLLADQPLLTADDVQAVLVRWRERAPGKHLLVPRFEGRPGHPLVLDAIVRRFIDVAAPGSGVREWRQTHPDAVEWLGAAHGRYTFDLDTLDDVQRLSREYGLALSAMR